MCDSNSEGSGPGLGSQDQFVRANDASLRVMCSLLLAGMHFSSLP